MNASAPIMSRSWKLAPPKVDARKNPFDGFSVEEMTMLHAAAQRARNLVALYRIGNTRDEVLEVNDQITVIDFALTYRQRKLNLRAMMRADNLAFMADFSAMQQHIIRAENRVPLHFPMKFAQVGARY